MKTETKVFDISRFEVKAKDDIRLQKWNAFLLAGLGMLPIWALVSLMRDWKDSILIDACIAVLAIMILIILAAVQKIWFPAVQHRQRMDQYPDQPWKWREEWASGRIQSDVQENKSFLRDASIGCLFLGCVLLYGQRFLIVQNPVVPVLGVLSLAGATLLLYLWVRRRYMVKQFGIAVLRINPAYLDRHLRAEIEIPSTELIGNELKVELQCFHRIPTSRTWVDQLLWSGEQRNSIVMDRQTNKSVASINIELPANSESTTLIFGPYGIHWDLTISVSSADFCETIREIPIFISTQLTH